MISPRFLGLMVLPALAGAQTTVAPDSNTTKFVVAGIPVILRKSTSADVATADVYLLGGTREATDQTAGIEPFLLDVSERGTRHFSRAVLRQTMARLGSGIVVDAAVDWTAIGVRATSETFDSTWVVLADRVMYPTLDNADIELIRQQYASAVRQRRDSPDALVEYLADSATFSGHSYGRSIGGTEQTIAAITRKDLVGFQATKMVRSRMLIVVIGNVDRARIEKLILRTLGALPLGTYKWTLPPATGPRSPALIEVNRELPTNYILGYYQGPSAMSPDYQALRVATAVLSGRLFSEVRDQRNLSYAVNAPFVERALAEGGLYVTTGSPDTVLSIMRTEVGHLQHAQVDPAALERLVQQFITEYFLDNETNADQANFLARAELYRGDYRSADRFVSELRRVTPEDVRRVAQKYMHDIAFAYVGDTTKLGRSAVAGF